MSVTARSSRPRSAGFTILELIVVMGIMLVLSAVAIPQVARYFKNYQINGAAQQVAGEITAARGKAISKNVNQGAVFVVLSSNTYQWVIEDDVTPPIDLTPVPVATILSDATYLDRRGPQRALPHGLVFGTSCATTPSFTATDPGFRFNRLGAWCDPTSSDTLCPALGTVGSTLVMNGAAGATVCLESQSTGLRRWVTVSPAGRTQVRQ
jgi:prepilin-type N-terminal cleavage/methylation domain-containing protein